MVTYFFFLKTRVQLWSGGWVPCLAVKTSFLAHGILVVHGSFIIIIIYYPFIYHLFLLFWIILVLFLVLILLLFFIILDYFGPAEASVHDLRLHLITSPREIVYAEQHTCSW